MSTNLYIIIQNPIIKKSFLEKIKDFIISNQELFYFLLFIIFLCFFIYFLHKNIILKNKKIVTFIFLAFLFPFLFLLLIPIFKDSFTLDGWFSFLGGYIGVTGAIGTVWWQLNEEKIKNEKELILSNNNNVYSFLILSQKIAKDFAIICVNYLLNKTKNNNDIIYIKEIFTYERESLIDFLSKIDDTRIKNDIIFIITLFSSFHNQGVLSSETKGKNIFKDNIFYLKNFEIFMNLEKNLGELLEKIKKDEINISAKEFIENTEKKLKALKENINKIESLYPSYFETEDISNEKIEKKLKEYKV